MLFRLPPLDFVDLPADAQHKGGFEPRHIQAIWLHATVGTDSRAWLTTDPRSRASAHRLITKRGVIYKLVDDAEAAWTEGPAVWYDPPGVLTNPNRTGLSIEFENLNDGKDPYPLAQVAQGANQCAEWVGMYGFLPILNHTYLQGNKTDPAGFPRRSFDSMLYDVIRTGRLINYKVFL